MKVDALVNGEQTNKLAARDRSVAYGDGVFETLRARPGFLPAWESHIARLQQGCLRLGINAPEPKLLRSELLRLLDENGEGVVKLIVSRGEGGRGYAAPNNHSPNRLVLWSPSPRYVGKPWQGAITRECELTLSDQPVLAGIKHLNRLEQVLARREWADSAVHEGLLGNQRGELIEGVSSNLILIQGRKATTPMLGQQGVMGVMRGRVMDSLEQQGFQLQEAAIKWSDIADYSHILLTNAVIGVWPVRELRLLDRSLLLPAGSSSQPTDRMMFKLPEWLPDMQSSFDLQDGLSRHCAS